MSYQSVSFKHSVDSLSNHGSAKKKFRSATSSSNVNGCLDQPLQVMFVCGADNLANFAVPNLWDPNHVSIFLEGFALSIIKVECFVRMPRTEVIIILKLCYVHRTFQFLNVGDLKLNYDFEIS